MRLPPAQTSAAIRVNGVLRTTPADLSADAVFPIYSITKTLTAVCVLRATELGYVAVDDPASRWLEDVSIPATITLTHLLRHRSGVRDYGPLPEYHEAVRACPNRPWSRKQFLNAVLPQGLLFPPGDRFSYSNVGYMLLVNILERATRRTFASVLDEFIVSPLKLRRTSVLERVDDLNRCVPGFGSEITADNSIIDVRGRYHPGWCAPRLVASTVEDITSMFDALLAGQLLETTTLEQMLTLMPLSKRPDETIAGGMGVYCDRASRWGTNYHHGGGGPGYGLAAAVYPTTPLGRVSVAVFVNSSCEPPCEQCESLLTGLVGGS